MTCAKNWIVSNRRFPGAVASNPEELTRLLGAHSPEAPQRIYFPFWSWKVPIDILARYTCIGFHSSPLPFGRGGSPIQNMIRLGHKKTELCAFKMTSNFDEGEVLLRVPVSLEGTLSEIIDRLSCLITVMIVGMESPEFAPGEGIPNDEFKNIPVHFKRITENHLTERDTLGGIYDEIRMRDDEGHPKAFKYHGKHVIEFTGAELKDGEIKANVRIS